MSEIASSADEAPTYVIDGLGAAQRAAVAIREHGAIVADFRAVQEPIRRRVLDTLNGAALANGNSPFLLATGVWFLTTGRPPSQRDHGRYRGQEGDPRGSSSP
jgi:hypothetical protein